MGDISTCCIKTCRYCHTQVRFLFDDIRFLIEERYTAVKCPNCKGYARIHSISKDNREVRFDEYVTKEILEYGLDGVLEHYKQMIMMAYSEILRKE